MSRPLSFPYGQSFTREALAAFGLGVPEVVGYIKDRGPKQLAQDSTLVRQMLATLGSNPPIVIEPPETSWGKKFAGLQVDIRLRGLKTIVVPDLSHLGFGNSWESTMMDALSLADRCARLISIRDNFDSKDRSRSLSNAI